MQTALVFLDEGDFRLSADLCDADGETARVAGTGVLPGLLEAARHSSILHLSGTR